MWLQCVLVGAVWGLTNALMRLADASYTKQDGDNTLTSLIKNWRWLIAFALNQSGSMLFYVTLKDANLALAVPICQATTLLFNVLGAMILGEPFHGDPKWIAFGVLLISVGVAIMRDSHE